MYKNCVELSNFWPDGYTGHTDSSGADIGKAFLQSLFQKELENGVKNINHQSHFFRDKNITKVRSLISKLVRIFRQDKLTKHKLLHGHENQKYDIKKDYINIWYTSENLRPPLHESFDLYLSHDIDDYDGRNIYLPIWATRLGTNLNESARKQESLALKRNTSVANKKGICAVISNPEPIRMAFLSELRKHFTVDVFGAFGFPVTDKAEVLSHYKLNVCFENDEYPGYVTEKPFEAWSNESIPVWRGLDSSEYLNQDAIINVTELGFQEAIKRIYAIIEDDEEYLRVSGLSILKKGYDYKLLESKISALFTHRKSGQPS